MANLVFLREIRVRKVMCGDKHIHILWLHSIFVQILSDDLTDKVFSGSRPPVKAENERLRRILIVNVSTDQPDHSVGHEMLPVQLTGEIILESWNTCKKREPDVIQLKI